MRHAAVICVAALLCACSSLGARRGDGSVALAGLWTLDRSHSDDAAKIVAARLAKMRPVRRMHPPMGRGDVPPLENPDDLPDGDDPGGPPGTAPGDPGGARRPLGPTHFQRMLGDSVQQFLDAPDRLEWEYAGESVKLRYNAEPERILDAGERAARFDSSGAMTVLSGWDGAAFVIEARYVNGERRRERYLLDRDGNTLRVERSTSGSMLGTLTTHNLYRRATS